MKHKPPKEEKTIELEIQPEAEPEYRPQRIFPEEVKLEVELPPELKNWRKKEEAGGFLGFLRKLFGRKE